MDRYSADFEETQFEPGSRGRVLRNKLGIRRVREMQQAETQALLALTEALLDEVTETLRFTEAYIVQMHRRWLGEIYPWAGEYRRVNMAKDGFLFAAVQAAAGRDYGSMGQVFESVLRRTLRTAR